MRIALCRKGRPFAPTGSPFSHPILFSYHNELLRQYSYIVVSGAGSPDVNGEYYPIGMLNDAFVWENKQHMFLSREYIDSQFGWIFGNMQICYYGVNTPSSFPPDQAAWRCYSGREPAPQLQMHLGGECQSVFNTPQPSRDAAEGVPLEPRPGPPSAVDIASPAHPQPLPLRGALFQRALLRAEPPPRPRRVPSGPRRPSREEQVLAQQSAGARAVRAQCAPLPLMTHRGLLLSAAPPRRPRPAALRRRRRVRVLLLLRVSAAGPRPRHRTAARARQSQRASSGRRWRRARRAKQTPSGRPRRYLSLFLLLRCCC